MAIVVCEGGDGTCGCRAGAATLVAISGLISAMRRSLLLMAVVVVAIAVLLLLLQWLQYRVWSRPSFDLLGATVCYREKKERREIGVRFVLHNRVQ